MTLKNNLLNLLNENRDKYLSGENLAESFSVTRTAIWKGIKSLKEEGYSIEAISNKGYRLTDRNDILSRESITKHLRNSSLFSVQYHDRVSSTNDLVKDQINEPEGLVVVASAQEKGVGRLNRNFYSPQNTGVYFSILLKPNLESTQAVRVTTMAAVAVCNALKNTLGIEPGIKWVNDIFYEEKKVCGILTQGAFSLETNKAEYIILGIGINVYPPQGGFPKDIKNIAGSVSEEIKSGLKGKIVAEIINEFFEIYKDIPFEETARKYKSLSFVIGKEVLVIQGENERKAKVLDIDENCNLRIENEDKTIETLSSGEIRIKKIKGEKEQ